MSDKKPIDMFSFKKKESYPEEGFVNEHTMQEEYDRFVSNLSPDELQDMQEFSNKAVAGANLYCKTNNLELDEGLLDVFTAGATYGTLQSIAGSELKRYYDKLGNTDPDDLFEFEKIKMIINTIEFLIKLNSGKGQFSREEFKNQGNSFQKRGL